MVMSMKTKHYKRWISLLSIGMLTFAAGLTQANAQSGQNDGLDQIGEQFKYELEKIDATSFGLPSPVAQHDSPMELSDEAKQDIHSLMDEQASIRAISNSQLNVLSSNIAYVGHEVLEQKTNETVVKYRYVITRETEDLKGDEAWQEAPEFTLKVDPTGEVVKDIDWVSEDEADVISEQSQSYLSDEDIVSDEDVAFTRDQLVGVQDKGAIPTSLTRTQRHRVAGYALTYWNSNNPAYVSYHDDCTNYVSQALHHGGWGMINGWYTSPDVWWARKSPVPPYSSHTWAGAENFYKFAVHASRRAALSPGRDVAHLRVGDILQYKRFDSSVMNHSMVVTKIKGRRIFLTYHSPGNNQKNRPLDHPNFRRKHFYPLNV